MNEHILIVEDEEGISRCLELELTHEGYQVEKAFDGERGLDLAQSALYDLILLDILLPGISGMEVLRRLRQQTETPVILLTAKDAVSDRVTGLDAGADDYICKPFAIEELLARIRTVLRKRSIVSVPVLTAAGLSLDTQSYEVTYNGTPLELTKREFDLLYTLLVNKGIVLDRGTLLNKVWGYEYMGETNIVDVYIRYLRAKIDDVYAVKLIDTVRGVGYVIKNQ